MGHEIAWQTYHYLPTFVNNAYVNQPRNTDLLFYRRTKGIFRDNGLAC